MKISEHRKAWIKYSKKQGYNFASKDPGYVNNLVHIMRAFIYSYKLAKKSRKSELDKTSYVSGYCDGRANRKTKGKK